MSSAIADPRSTSNDTSPNRGQRNNASRIKVLRLRQPQTQLKAWALRLIAFAIFAGIWQLAAIRADSILIPTFLETVRGFWELTFTTGELWPALGVSNLALVAGFLAAVAVSLPLGLAMARWRVVDDFFNPLVAVSLALPIAPLVPVILVAMGLGLLPKVVVIFLFSWVFIVTNVRAGVRTADKSLIDMARSYGASEATVWWRILIPSALPAIFSGLRVGLGRAFAGMVIVELIMLPVGIGALLLDFRGDFRADLLYATVIAVVIEAVLITVVMQFFEKRLSSWR